MQDPDLNFDASSIRLTNIGIVIFLRLNGNVYLFIEGNIVKRQLHNFLRGAKFGYVPYGLSDLYCGFLIKH